MIARPTLIYVGDPMCSWCYGFGPILTELLDRLGQRVDFSLLVGGLRPFTAQAIDDALRAHLRHHWQAVAQASGQPFDFALLERSDFVYDTEPSCRAVVTVRAMREECALPLFLGIQDAFYRDSCDPTLPGTLADAAADLGLDRSAFLARFDSDEMRNATFADFEAVERLGIRGFPTLLLRWDDFTGTLCQGYARAEPMIKAVEQLLDQTAAL